MPSRGSAQVTSAGRRRDDLMNVVNQPGHRAAVAIALDDLLLHSHREIGQHALVHLDRSLGARQTMELEIVDVIGLEAPRTRADPVRDAFSQTNRNERYDKQS